MIIFLLECHKYYLFPFSCTSDIHQGFGKYNTVMEHGNKWFCHISLVGTHIIMTHLMLRVKG
jgi:hypothetical protein